MHKLSKLIFRATSARFPDSLAVPSWNLTDAMFDSYAAVEASWMREIIPLYTWWRRSDKKRGGGPHLNAGMVNFNLLLNQL